MSLKSASTQSHSRICPVMLVAQPGDVHVHIHFGGVEKLAMPLFVRESFIDRFFKRIFPMECRIVTIWSISVDFYLGMHTSVEPTGCIKVSIGYWEQYRRPDWKPRQNARFPNYEMRCNSNTKVSVALITSHVGLIYLEPQPNSMRHWISLLASGIVRALPSVLIQIRVGNMRSLRQHCGKEC